MSVTLTGLATDAYYTVAVTAVDLGGNESPCSTTAGALARDDGTGTSSAPSAASSSDSSAVDPSEPVAAISSEGEAVPPGDDVAVTPTDGAVDGPVEGTDGQVWRWRY